MELGNNKVCRIKKSLYGLKQSPRAWFQRFGKIITSYRNRQSQADHTIFYKHFEDNKTAILTVYVDDIILTENDEEGLVDLKNKLASEFQIKDLGALKCFLGMEFARSKKRIFVNWREYVKQVYLGCWTTKTPIVPNLKLQDPNHEKVKDKGRYQRLVGRVIYLSHTCPDIAFVVSMVNQFMHSPRPTHFKVVYRILRYLKGTPGKGILF